MNARPPTPQLHGPPLALRDSRADAACAALLPTVPDPAAHQLALSVSDLDAQADDFGDGADPWLLGERLADRFVVERRLGEGGMGVVFEALDEQRGERVALKTLGQMDGTSVYRIKQEFRALADLQHPRLVRLHELFADGALWFFTMARVEGVPFIEYVRASSLENEGTTRDGAPASPPGLIREVPLREAFAQLVDGVSAIHAAGKLHRDLKPSNVLVDSVGRVTILDFGLVQPVLPDPERSAELVAGTPGYMAPEQLEAGGSCVASDWYAVGAMLYEALTGRLPFGGSVLEMISAQLTGRQPAHPRDIAPGAPRDLADLAMALIQGCAEDRPLGSRVAELVGAPRTETSVGSQSVSGESLSSSFFGRGPELARLRSAYAAARQGEAGIVFVAGVSGIGKSALVERFLDEVRGDGEADPVILSGRCYERESVPFKALDAVVDALSRHLRKVGTVAAAALMPNDTPELCRIFPVLARVAAFARPLPGHAVIPDLHEVRRRGFQALRETFSRIADQRPLVVCIDDLQWGDIDSGLFLTQLLAPPDPPRMLLLGCYRSDEVERSALLKMLRSHAALSRSGRVETLEVKPLGDDDARELAGHLLAARHGELLPEAVAEIAAEAGGSPFFVAELTRQARVGGFSTHRASLAELIASRVSELLPEARTLLEVVAIAGGPIPRDAALRAAGLDAAADDAIPMLRAASLVRTSGTRPEEALETYHDRIRETLVASLSAETRRAYHLALANALESLPDPPTDRLAVHYREAGRRDEALAFTLKAARRAAEALAFDSAAALYRNAVDLSSNDDRDARREVEVLLGEALSNAGRGAAAADAFMEAAHGASNAEVIDLERRAASELLTCGEMDRGLELTRTLCARIGGMWIPRSAMVAQTLGLARFLYFYFFGSAMPARPTRSIDARSLQRMDVGMSLGLALSRVDPPMALYLSGTALSRSARARDPLRVAQGLLAACIATTAFLRPRDRRLAEWVEALQRIGEEQHDTRLVGHSLLSRGMVAGFGGQWRAARAAFEEAETRLLRCSCVGMELLQARSWQAWSLFHLGEIHALSERVSALANDARERGNLLALNSYVSAFGPPAWLARDDLETASREADETFARWPVRGYPLQRYWHLLAHQFIDLYAGEGARLSARVEGEWSALRRSGLLLSPLIRQQMQNLRGCAALAAATQQTGGVRSRALLAAAERHACSVARNRIVGSVPFAALVLAGVARARAENHRATELLASAARDFDAADMRMYAVAARRQLGRVVGGDEGAALVEQADAAMRAEGIVRPDRFAAMLAPGFPA